MWPASSYSVDPQQANPTIAFDGPDQFVAAWSSGASQGTDQSQSSVQIRRFGQLPPNLPALGLPALALLAVVLLGGGLRRMRAG